MFPRQSCQLDSLSQVGANSIHLDCGHPLALRTVQVAKDARPSKIVGEVSVAWDQVDVQVLEALRLGEERQVDLHAAGDIGHSSGDGRQEWTQRCSLARRQLGEGDDMTS